MVPYDISRSPAALRQWLSDQRVTVLSQTPSAFRGLEEADRVNMYGITEATVHSTFKRVLGQDLESNAIVSVGKPLDGWSLRLLDEHQVPVARGTAGELYIEGAGVAQGYLNRSALNAERFIQLPGSSTRAYRTGDLLILGDDGEYRYAGRCDEQLKISGF